ncbi:MAG: transposase, partial [Blastocatellia bacterium]
MNTSTPDNLPKEWHDRGRLPHFAAGEVTQFITFRLGDSVPAWLLRKWEAELAREPVLTRHSQLRKRIETFLDESHGECHLRRPDVATLVENAILFFHGERYEILSWCVMPNHVHLLLTPRAGFGL